MTESTQDRLIVMLEARITEFEKRMARADQTAGRRMRNVESHAERMRKRVDASLARVGAGAFRGLAVGAAAALAPILSIGAALRTAQSALQDFDNLGNKAKMFGVDVEALQELRYAAEQGGMAVGNFDTALRRFIRRSAEAAQGTGAAKGAFKELGIELTDASGRMKASEALLREVADAMQRVPNQADKLRLAFQMFDTDGAAMVNVLADGSAGLDEFARKARDLGFVIDREMIARTQEMKKELDTATTVMNSHFQQALIDIAPFLISTAKLAGAVASAIASISDAMRSIENKTSSGLETRLGELRGMLAEERDYIEDLKRRGPAQWNMGGTNLMETALEREQSILAQLRQVEMEIFRRADQQSMATLPRSIPDDAILPETPETRNNAAEAAVKQAEAVARIVANLEHEQAQLGRTAEEQELYNLLKAAGVERESEYGQAIEAALGPLQDQRAAIEANAEAMKLFEDAASSAMQTFIDDLIAGKDAGEALGNVLRNLGSQLISMGIKGFTSSLSGMLFPGFAAGGYTGHGGKHQPAGIVHGGEYVFSKEATQRAGVGNLEAMHKRLKGYSGGGIVAPAMPALPSVASIQKMAVGGGGGDNITISMPINIDAAGADIAAVARLQQQVERLKVELPGQMQKIVRDRGRTWK